MSTKKPKYTAEMSGGIPWPDQTVLGVDPSMAATGWAIVQFNRGGRPTVLDKGTIVTTENEGFGIMRDVIERSMEVHTEMAAILERYRHHIGHTAIELFVPPPKGGIKSQSGSLAVIACAAASRSAGMEVTFYQPKQTKFVVSGSGTATKAEVKDAVFEWLGMAFRANTNVTDAIAAAITHCIGDVP